jgi:molybdenum cofactor biosynthesis enzyme MoaA
MTKPVQQSVCGNCQSFKLEKDKKFFNCLSAKHGGLKYGMQVRVDSQACEAFVAK